MGEIDDELDEVSEIDYDELVCQVGEADEVTGARQAMSDHNN